MPRAVGLLEIRQITQGIAATDQMCKQSAIEVIMAQTVCPGKFIVMIAGDIASVENALEKGKSMLESHLLADEFVIANLHSSIFPAFKGKIQIIPAQALGIIETYSIAAAILAADTAVKAADVKVLEIRLARWMGGKSIMAVTGELSSVTMAIQAGSERIQRKKGVFVSQVILPAPHPQLTDILF